MQTRAVFLWAAVLGTFVVAGNGCDAKSLGAVFSELSGEYRIPEYDCWIRVSGSHVTAVGEDGESPCVHTETDQEETVTETLTVDGTISENRVKGTMTYTEEFSELFEDCDYHSSYTADLHLDVSMDEAAQSSGKFSALAGAWTGTLDIVEDWTEEMVAGAECEDESYSENDQNTWFYDIDAEIEGTEAFIHYGEEGDDWDAFYVEAPADDELIIDGEDVEIQ